MGASWWKNKITQTTHRKRQAYFTDSVFFVISYDFVLAYFTCFVFCLYLLQIADVRDCGDKVSTVLAS